MNSAYLTRIAELKQIIDKGGTIRIKLESGATFHMTKDNLVVPADVTDEELTEEEARQSIMAACSVFGGVPMGDKE
jgi:hypothetical protein